MRRNLVIFLVTMLLIPSVPPALGQTYDVQTSEQFKTLFLPFFQHAIRDDGSIPRDLSNNKDKVSTGFAAGLSIVTLVKLFDLYNESKFLDFAMQTSDYIGTLLEDPRYPLFATYYDESSEFTSNYRSVVDNFLIAWGLSELSQRIDQSDVSRVLQENSRVNSVVQYLNYFDNPTGFKDEIRADNLDISSTTFDVFPNLFAAFIISESKGNYFDLFSNKPIEVFNFVKANVTNDNGGVHTIYFNGFTDNIVSLRNTILYANLAMNLYEQSGEQTYLDTANSTMQYIQNKFFDIGVTGGYFESLVDELPVQQSKSLFSHALLLQLLLKLSNTGDVNAKTYFISLWRTISKYFQDGDSFFTTLNRGGKPSSSAINTIDNVMMLYSMSSIPLFSSLNYTSDIEFKDQIMLDLDLQIPKNIDSQMILYVDDAKIEQYDLSGSDGLINKVLTLDPIRPSNEVENFKYKINLITQGVLTDSISFEISVSLSPGVDLSIGVITVFSVITIVIFVLFVKRYENIEASTG